MAEIIVPPGNTYSTSETSGSGYPGDAATGHGVRFIANVLDSIDARDIDIVDKVVKKGSPVRHSKTEWANKARMPLTVTLGEALDTSETDIDFATGHGNRLQQGHVIWIPVDASGNAEEFMIVTDDADDTDTRTVDRGELGSSGVAHDTGTVCQIIGIAMPENSDHPLAQWIFGDLAYNYRNRFAAKVKMDSAADVQRTVEDPNGNVFERRLMEVAEDLKLLLNRTLIMSERQRGTGATTPGAASMAMSGIRHFCELSGNTYDLEDGLLTVNGIEDALYDLWVNVGGNMGDTLLCSMQTARIFDTQLNPRREFDARTNSINFVFREWTSRLGTFKLRPSRWIIDDEIYVVNERYLEYNAFEGLDWHFARKEPGVETDGDYVIGSISGDFTFQNHAIEACALVKNWDTDLTHYPVDVVV